MNGKLISKDLSYLHKHTHPYPSAFLLELHGGALFVTSTISVNRTDIIPDCSYSILSGYDQVP